MQKLSFGTKISYGIGAFGKDLVYAIVATFLMYYLTDILIISPIFVGSLFLFARIWDAINDPVMGIIVDNTKSKWGKFRPWILIGTLINAVILALLYFKPGISGVGLYVYIAIFYILWGMTYTIMDIPYWSMIPVLTNDKSERDTITAIPRIFASLAWLVVGSFGLKIVATLGGGDSQKGFSLFALIISVLFILASLLTVVMVKERVKGEGKEKDKEKTSVSQAFQILLKNDQVFAVLGTSLLFNITFQLSNGFAIYYFKYVWSDEQFFSVYAMVAGLAQMGGLAVYPKLSQLISRKRVFLLACLLPILGFASLILFDLRGLHTTLMVGVCSAIVNVGIGFTLALSTVMLADVVDYGEYKLHTRNESIIFSTQTFVVKFAGAFSGFLIGAGLSMIGYVADKPQAQGTITGIRVLMIIVPILLCALCILVYNKFYKLNGQFQANILKELEARNKN